MNRFTRIALGCAAAAAINILTAPRTNAQALSPADQQQLLGEVHDLRAEVDAMKKQQDAMTVVTPPTTSPVDTTQPDSHNILAHFDKFMSGYDDDRFALKSRDGNFVLRPWLHIQFRDVTSDREDFKVGGSDETDNGFEVRRLRLGFDGNMFSPDLTYQIDWATVRASGTSTVTNAGKTVGTVSNNLGGTPLLEEGWFKYQVFGSPFFIRGGQIKDPIYHESMGSSRYFQTIERSLVADIFFNGDSFAEGVTVGYDPKSWFRTEGGIDHGLRSANTNFLDYPNSNAFNFGGVARGEVKLFGRWQDYQMGASGVKEPLLVAGLGSEISERGHANQTVAAADLMYADQNGLSLFGGFADRYTDHNFGIATQSATGASIAAPPAAIANTATNEYGIVGQAGYLFGQHIEPFGRYEYLHLEGTAAGSHNYFSSITGGANYYFYGHRAKLTAEATYLPIGIPIDDTPSDVLASPNKHGEFLFDLQFQLLL